MNLSPESHELLMTMLDTPAPAGFEAPAAAVVAMHAATFADVHQDPIGNVWARRGSGTGPRIAMFGHLDEIGLIVTRIDDDGFVRVEPIGSWDPAVLVGQQVQICASAGVVHGVLARPPIHMLRSAGTEQAITAIPEMWIDIAVSSADEAQQLVAIGDPVVLAGAPRIERGRIISRSLDNRLGTFVALEVLRQLPNPTGDIYAVATVREEIGGAGAYAAAHAIRPDRTIVIDLSPATDIPGGHPLHVLKQGHGPGLNRGSSNTDSLVNELADTAARHGIPVQLRGLGMSTSTDADRVVYAAAGTQCAYVSLPARYVHSPHEMVHMDDVHHLIHLLTAWITDQST